jgi:branched-chain amino acid aminotransferase
MNLTMLEEARSRGYDEVVLLNERGEVAECTSANIFAARGKEVWTPPLASGCLPGITRELLLGEAQAEGVRVIEKTMTPEELESADEVFISSTTRDLLPVSHIRDRKIQTRGDAREKLQEAFSRYVDEYVATHRRQSVG